MRVSVGAAATVLAGAVAVGVAGTAFARSSSPPPVLTAKVDGTVQTPDGPLPHAFLELATWPDSLAGPHGTDGGPHPDWVSYGPSTNLAVPAHSLVTVTIRQYDSGEEITNPFFAAVHGTVDGTMTVDGKTVHGWDPEQIGHTFTVHGAAATKDPLFVSVPLPAVPDDAEPADNGYAPPHVVTFSFETKGPGEYVWQCEFPCGDGTYAKFGGPMSQQGYMSGTLTVTGQA